MDQRSTSRKGTQERRASLAKRVMFVVVVTAAFALISWLAVAGAVTRGEWRAATQREVRVVELRGTIAYLDEWMTMSARMAASSGNRRWADRYAEAVPKLDAAITEAAELATPEVRAALVSTTNEAHRDLVIMERRALTLVAQGDSKGATALLESPEFDYLKDVYAAGIDVFGQDLTTIANRQATELSDRAWLEAAGVGLSAILLISTVLMVRGQARLRGAMALTAAVARTDDLTDLPNRRQFYEQCEATLADTKNTGLHHALFLIDLDRFKVANDSFGHPAGDQLLKLVAGRLRAVARAGQLVARLGGDEFALVVPFEVTSPSQTSLAPGAVATQIVDSLERPFMLASGTAVQIGASVGIALASPGGKTIDDLIYQADLALYRAKAEGRSCFRFFEQGMDAQVRARALLERDLRQALADDAIVPHFQPLVDLKSGRFIGVEMLARWPHPMRGAVSPAEFIPVAEDLGLIVPLTNRLLQRACTAAAHWPDHLTLACNISPLQLRDHTLPAMVRGVLEQTGFPAHRLKLEITESALVGDLELAGRVFGELKVLGVRLALDDFGTGYASLRNLQSLPFDTLKIDASFVGAMLVDKESEKIVSAVIGLGRSLGLCTVAEGVETAEAAALLRTLGCDIGQGWFFGRPCPVEMLDLRLRGVTDAERPAVSMVA